MRSIMVAKGQLVSSLGRKAPIHPKKEIALRVTCATCAAVIGRSAVYHGPTIYCSIECAQADSYRHAPGNYLG